MTMLSIKVLTSGKESDDFVDILKKERINPSKLYVNELKTLVVGLFPWFQFWIRKLIEVRSLVRIFVFNYEKSDPNNLLQKKPPRT